MEKKSFEMREYMRIRRGRTGTFRMMMIISSSLIISMVSDLSASCMMNTEMM